MHFALVKDHGIKHLPVQSCFLSKTQNKFEIKLEFIGNFSEFKHFWLMHPK